MGERKNKGRRFFFIVFYSSSGILLSLRSLFSTLSLSLSPESG